MPKTTTKPKRLRRRPVVRIMPERIPDTPENVVRARFQGPPKPDGPWKFMKLDGARYVTESPPTNRRSRNDANRYQQAARSLP